MRPHPKRSPMRINRPEHRHQWQDWNTRFARCLLCGAVWDRERRAPQAHQLNTPND